MYINEHDGYSSYTYKLVFVHGLYKINASNEQEALEEFADWCINNAPGYLYSKDEEIEEENSFYGSYGNCLNELPLIIKKVETPTYKVFFSSYLWTDEALELGEQESIDTWEQELTLPEIIKEINDNLLSLDSSIPDSNYSQEEIMWNHSNGYETGTVLHMHIDKKLSDRIQQLIKEEAI